MRGWHHIDDEALFWTTLLKVRESVDHPTAFDTMPVEVVMGKMMSVGNGRFNPRTLHERLVEIDEAGGRPDWRLIALYLAECQVATATYDGTLKSTSMSRRLRFASICRDAAAMFRNLVYTKRDSYDGTPGNSSRESVIRRLEDAVRELGV